MSTVYFLTNPQLAKGETLDQTFGHAMHCVGGLLRDVICYADDSMPLHGETDNNNYQYVRKCRNWAAMAEFAGQHTSCMTTGADGILDRDSQDLENCDRTDGIQLSSVSS